MKKKLLSVFILLFIFGIISGCTSNEEKETTEVTQNKEEKEEVVQEIEIVEDQFLLFVNTDTDGNIGDLYWKRNTGEKEKIASDVQSSNYQFIEEKNAVIFYDKDSQLFIKNEDKEKEAISTEKINQYKLLDDQSGIFLTKGDINDLYLYKWDKEMEKIASNTTDYLSNSSGDVVVFIDDEKNLYYVGQDSEKQKIASDVIKFILSEDTSTVYYLNEDLGLYYRDLSDIENEKMTSGSIVDLEVSADGKTVMYLNEYDFENQRGELYRFVHGEDPKKISSDVTQYEVWNDGEIIHYLNTEKNLILYNVSKDEKEKISGGVESFSSIDSDTVLYIDEDSNYYIKEKDKEKEKIGSDFKNWVVNDQSIIFINSENDLYIKDLGIEKEKISSEVEYFTVSESGNTISYYTNNQELFLKSHDEESEKILDNVNEYYEVSLGNNLIFIRSLQLDDIEGIWYSDEFDVLVEISDQDKFKIYALGEFQEQTDISLESYTLNTGLLTVSDNPENDEFFNEEYEMNIEIVSETEILFDSDTFIKLTQEELEQKLANQKEEMEEANAAIEAQRELELKIAESQQIANDILYTYLIITKDGANFREEPNINGALLGTLNYGGEFFISDTYIDETGRLWCMVGAYDEYDSYFEGWVAYSNFK